MRQFDTLRRGVLVCVAMGAMLFPQTTQAQVPVSVQFDTELIDLSYSGGPFLVPLASDPNNMLGDSVDGYGFVESLVSFQLSSQRLVVPGPHSQGSTCAVSYLQTGKSSGAETTRAAYASKADCGDPALPIDPEVLDGESLLVDSFFDVFFDLTFTDVDSRPGRDYAGMPDGASITLVDIGPAQIASNHLAVFDKQAPNFGLFPPPEVDPYLGFFQIEIPLGGDINGNGEDDKIKFTLGTIAVGDQNRSFIVLPSGTVINQWDGAMVLDAAVVDVSTDPPFRIGAMLPGGLPNPNAFGGPTTATSVLVNEIAVPVEGTSWGAIKSMYRGAGD